MFSVLYIWTELVRTLILTNKRKWPDFNPRHTFIHPSVRLTRMLIISTCSSAAGMFSSSNFVTFQVNTYVIILTGLEN